MAHGYTFTRRAADAIHDTVLRVRGMPAYPFVERSRRVSSGGGAAAKLAYINTLEVGPPPSLGCYWLELDSNGLLVPITDTEYDVKAFTYEFESWTMVTPPVVQGSIIPVMQMLPDRDAENKLAWYCLFPFVGVCESVAGRMR